MYSQDTGNGVPRCVPPGGVSGNMALKEKIHLHKKPPPPPFSLSLRSVNIFFSHFFLYVRQTVTLPWYNQLWLLGRGGGYHPQTTHDGGNPRVCGREVKKECSPLLHRAVIPSIRATTQQASCFQRKDHTRRERSQTGLPQGPNRHLKLVVTTQQQGSEEPPYLIVAGSTPNGVFFYHQFLHVNAANAFQPTAANSMLQVLIVTKLVKKSSFCMKTEG